MTKTTCPDRLAEAQQMMIASLEGLIAYESWAAWLDTAARFDAYSFRNVLLIFTQRPDATWVAGYKTWQKMGRQVRKGEKGIRILAPGTGPCHACHGEGMLNNVQRCDRCAGMGYYRWFHMVTVFDVSQTDGDPLPGPQRTRPLKLLSGDAPAGLWDRLTSLLTTQGWRVARGSCFDPKYNGQADYASRTVTVRPDLSAAQAAKTLAHEVGHVLLHADEHGEHSRERREVEAESVAYLVLHAAGIDTADYSLGYVASWSGRNIEIVRTTAERVLDCARHIITHTGLDSEAQPHDKAA